MDPKLSSAQRRVLTALVAAGGSKLIVGDELPRASISKLVSYAMVTVKHGGVTTKCPRSGVDVFTPGPATATITEAGRKAIA